MLVQWLGLKQFLARMNNSLEHSNDDDNNERTATDKRKGCKYNNNVLSRILKISIGVNIILLIVLTLFFLHRKLFVAKDSSTNNSGITQLQSESRQSNSGLSSDILCLDCHYFGPGVRSEETLYSFITYTDCGRRICCVQNEEYVNKLQTMLTHDSPPARQNRSVAKNSFSWWRNRKQSAHLYHDSGNKTSLKWLDQDDSDMAFSNLKLVNNNSTLEVSEKGTYFVYLALTFDFRHVRRVPLVYYSLTTSIFFREAPSVVAEGRYGGSTQSENIHTGLLCASVRLQRKSQIYAYVNVPRFINMDRYSTYFGMFKLL